MTTDTEETISSDSYKEIEPNEVKFQYHLYLFFFIVIYFGSFILPGLVYMLYSRMLYLL